MITPLGLVFGMLVAAELIGLVCRRAWVHWKVGTRASLVDDAISVLAGSLVTGVIPERPRGRTRRRAFRLAALELFAVLAGDSRRKLTSVVEELGLVDDVIRTLRRSPRAYARRTATDELGEMAGARAVPALQDALRDRDRIVRITAVRALAALADPSPVERVAQILDRDSSAAPSSAILAMAALATAAPDVLVELERSATSPFARRLAALSLARVGDRRGLPGLAADLASNNALLASVAVGALERVGGDDAIHSLERVNADAGRDAALREQAERALARLETDRA
jgi:HEAT repeat protein